MALRNGSKAVLIVLSLTCGGALAFGSARQQQAANTDTKSKIAALTTTSNPDQSLKPVRKTEAEWRHVLTPEQFEVTRQAGTEAPESSPLTHFYNKGTYVCADCGLNLFKSDTKFDSGTGWPSFWAPLDKTHVKNITDHSAGMDRIEVQCARCGAHLGHVFDDGPKPTGLRYCMNGVALKFVPAPVATPTPKPAVKTAP